MTHPTCRLSTGMVSTVVVMYIHIKYTADIFLSILYILSKRDIMIASDLHRLTSEMTGDTYTAHARA